VDDKTLEAAKILDVKEDEIQKFTMIDPFNNNKLEGFICRRSDHRYGALVIFRINGKETIQIVWATPKLHYPFDKSGVYNWPDMKDICFWEKLDGTNILSYRYYIDEKEFVTFKTRLTPIVQDGKFAPFYSLWKEMLNEKEWIMKLINQNSAFNLSFELFGSRNPITIKYSSPLDVCLLFGVDSITRFIVPPSKLNLTPETRLPQRYYLSPITNPTDVYNNFRQEMSNTNNQSEYLLIEGMVMYASVVGDPSWRMFKCKPEEVEKIHWTAGGSIPRVSLFNTGINTFESYDDPTIDNFIELLREEYPPELIIKNTLKINKIWEQVLQRMNLVKMVNDVWELAKKEGFDVTKDKNGTMRFMSKYFDRNIMSKVGGLILKQAGLLKDKEKKHEK